MIVFNCLKQYLEPSNEEDVRRPGSGLPSNMQTARYLGFKRCRPSAKQTDGHPPSVLDPKACSQNASEEEAAATGASSRSTAVKPQGTGGRKRTPTSAFDAAAGKEPKTSTSPRGSSRSGSHEARPNATRLYGWRGACLHSSLPPATRTVTSRSRPRTPRWSTRSSRPSTLTRAH